MDNGASSYRRFLDGDDNGIAEIVEDYKDGLILYLNGYVNNIFIAEELTEDTFFRLITKKPRYSGKSTFKCWLYAIGRNVAIDYIRHHSKMLHTPIEDMENYLSEEQSLEQSYLKEERKIIVHKAVSELSTDYRTILWLVFFEGFSNKEAAIVLKKNDRQIKDLLYRAKQSLKSKLEKEGFIYEEF
ncbi:MAG: RNA polymerase sigma factor [Agathobaculum sp.]|jgi:RNA polymerase sigma factor (sigma-70 family)|uniref:RNA polymerase sigma factor n=1 Tax=Agathobaculum sp. TaxID=2048138 RepID=UPI003D949376